MRVKVTLHVRVKMQDGSRKYCSPVYSANNKLRAGYALVDGKPEAHPEAVYALRYNDRGKRVWEHVGSDPAKALTAKLRREHILMGCAIGNPVVGDVEPLNDTPDPNRTLLKAAIESYVVGLEGRRKYETVDAYAKALDLFEWHCTKTYLDEITREDLLGYAAALTKKGQAARTVANRLGYIVTFLGYYGIEKLLKKTDKPKYTRRAPNSYSKEFLKCLFDVCTPEERLVFRFFLFSGCRLQEVSYACWSDLDLSRRMLTVREKPDLKWTLKDYEERSIPLPTELVEEMKARRAKRPDDRFIFPTRAGKPNLHLLRILKKVALRAGLNCGHCRAKNGQRCKDKPVCKHVELHRFRRTFATMMHENGVPVRTLMRLLGHSDLDTTLAYLASSDDEAQMRDHVDRAFAFCA